MSERFSTPRPVGRWHWWRCASIFLALALPAAANDPGGGVPTGGANVTLTTTSTTATLANGVIEAVIDKASARLTSYKFNGTQMLDPSGLVYYSLDGGASFDGPSNCVFSVVNSTTDSIEISCKRTWNATAGYKHNFDIDIHYVLRRGDTGVYSYAVLDHPAAYPATSFGEFRLVWKLPHDATNFFFEKVYADADRHWKMENYADFKNSTPTAIQEILKLAGTSWTGVLGSGFDCKYSYSVDYQTVGTWGHASDVNKRGVWLVPGGWDYFNDGPLKQDLALAESYLLIHFGRNHYGGSGTTLAEGEAWKKVYGPFLLYCNSSNAATNAADTLWDDARAQSATEQGAWPYAWMTNADYPVAAGRGTVTGRILVSDPLKPAVTAAHAWVGVAAPEDTAGPWQFQSKGYQTWVRADAAGNFSIRAVRPGTYTLHALVDGVVGEFAKTGITVAAGATNAQGILTWTVAHPGASIAWEIGSPNRSAREFRHGNDYFEPYLWQKFPTEFPNPLVYNVGTSSPATDWNFAQSARASIDGSGVTTYTAWDWKVNFNLPAVPATGNATLTVAVVSSHYARLFLRINDDPANFGRISPSADGGNALLRQGIYAKYSVVNLSIPVSKLRVGANTFTFSYGGADSGSHVMYDYLRLELPPFPPPPPSSGRSLIWKGGATTAANIWDNDATASWLNGATATGFGTGDKVRFDDSGSATPNLTLAAALAPESVTFDAAKNYALTGPGALTGEMSLVKSGAGKLTITPTTLALTGGATTAGSAVVTVASTAGAATGLGIAGAGLPAATKIASVDGTTQLTLSQAASANGTALTFTVGGVNTFTGPTVINGGAIAFTNDAGNISGLGTGEITLNGGTLSMYNNGGTSNDFSLPLYIPGGATGTFNVDARCSLSGKLTGSGTLNYVLPSGSVRSEIFGDWSGFTGQLNATAASGSADFRIKPDYAWAGLPGATLSLGPGVTAYWAGNLNSGTGSVVMLGALVGVAASTLKGGAINGRQLTYVVGGLGTDTTFAGTIAEQTNGKTNFVKTGPGTWTLSGSGAWNGATTVEQGTLRIVGSVVAASTVEVMDAAALDLAGSLSTASLHVADGGTLNGTGALTGNVVNDGSLTVGPGGSLTISGNLTNNGTLRVIGGAGFAVTGGTFENNGTVDLITAGTAGAPTSGSGITLTATDVKVSAFSLGAGSTPTLTLATVSGHNYQLQRRGDLASGNWSGVGAPKVGNDAAQIFTDPAPPASTRVFYRIVVSP